MAVIAPPGADHHDHDAASAASLAADALATEQRIALSEQPSASSIVEVVAAISSGDRVASGPSSSPLTTPIPLPAIDELELIEGLAVANGSAQVWLVSAASPGHALLAAASAKKVGASVVAIDANDVLGHPIVSIALKGQTTSSIRLIGMGPEVDPWHMAVLAGGLEVPGGGFLILPFDEPRRYVAFYGHPGTTSLGVLGEQGPQDTLVRMGPFLEAFTGDGSLVIPTFEIIVSVASAGATDDGDYSFEWPTSRFEEWIATAASEDVYVVLDLQSGRDDFLTQAKLYEELLRLPFVGLALDPEWRLRPDQVHLNQIGQVSAAEINQVIHWVADLVRDNGLPQKMLMVHQFDDGMIQNREVLESRPEIQLVIQVDGDGTESQKNRTYANLTRGAEDAFWAWGWKNFFDEDEPGPPSPESTMSKEPTPIFVSYQ